MDAADNLLFFESPVVKYAGNFFRDVPVILQYEEQPLVEVVGAVAAGMMMQFSIFNRDGVYLAKVKGSQMYLTKDGEKSGLRLLHPDRKTVCELDGQTLFEVEREGAAALSTKAELHTPDGRFLRENTATGVPEALIGSDGSSLRVSGVTMEDMLITGKRIGVHIRRDGSMAMATNGLPREEPRDNPSRA